VFSHVSLTGRVDLDLADYAEEWSIIQKRLMEICR
jgi:hypothetical protein